MGVVDGASVEEGTFVCAPGKQVGVSFYCRLNHASRALPETKEASALALYFLILCTQCI